MKTKRRLLIRGLALVLVIGAFASIAHATHEPGNAANSQQNLSSNPDTVLVASAAATPLAGPCGLVNAAREEAQVQVTSGSARIGDSTTGTSSGITLSSTNPPLKLEVTSALFGYSDAGATVNCSEIDR